MGKIKKICPICNKKFERPKYLERIKTCSRKCGYKLQGQKMEGNKWGFKKGHSQNKGRGQSKETKNKISESMKQQYKEGIRDRKEIVKKANQKTRELTSQGKNALQKWNRIHEHPLLGKTKVSGQYAEHRGFQKGEDNVVNKYPEKHPNYILAQKGHKTQPERVMEELLLKKGIAFEFQKRIGTYWVDFYIPIQNVIIECDGSYWHKKENTKREMFLKKQANIYHWKVKKYSKNIIRQDALNFLNTVREINYDN